MAAKINTRFILILVTVAAALAIGVGVLAFVAIRNDAGRNIASGDEAMAAGDYVEAANQYGRAVSKEKSNLEYVDKFQTAIEQLRPVTEADAVGRFRLLLGVLQQRARIRPRDIAVWNALLEETYRNAQVDSTWWEWLRDDSETAMRQLSEDTEGYDRIKMLHLIASSQVPSQMTEQDRIRLEQDFNTFVKEHPENVEAMVGYARWMIVESDKALLARNASGAKRMYDNAREAIDAAKEIAPDDFDVALWDVQAMVSRQSQTADPVTWDQAVAAAERLHGLALQQIERPVMISASNLLPNLNRRNGHQHAAEVAEAFLAKEPNSLLGKWILARHLAEAGDMVRARTLAESVLNSEPLPVSFMSTLRFQLRRSAAKLMFDISVREMLASGGQSINTDELMKMRDLTASVVTDPANDARVIECDAWIAFLNRDFAKAAGAFSRAIEKNPDADWRVYIAAAESMVNQNVPGEAVELLTVAVDKYPIRNVDLVAMLASLELQVGKTDEAVEHCEEVLAVNPEHRRAQLVLAQARRIQDPSSDSASTTGVVLAQADDLIEEGKPEEARQILLEAHGKSPANLAILQRLTLTEVQAGRSEEAVARLEGLIAQYPQQMELRALLQQVTGADPIDVLAQWAADTYPDGTNRKVALYIALRQGAMASRDNARRQEAIGDEGAAAASNALAARYDAEAERYLSELGDAALANSDFLNQRFVEALLANNHAEADRLAAKARETNADQARGLTYKARVDAAKGNIEAAAIALDEASKLTPHSVWVWRRLGQCYEQLGNVDRARASYLSALERQPNDAATIQLLVSLLVRSGDRNGAMTLVRDAAKRPGASMAVHELWLGMEAESGDPLHALEERERRYRENPGDRANAISLAVLSARTIPDQRSVKDARGNRLYSDSQWVSLPQAQREELVKKVRETWLRHAESIFSDLNADTSGELDVRYGRAVFFRETRRMPEANATIRDYLDSHASGPTPYVVFAGFYEEIGDLTTATAILREGLPHQSDADRSIDRALGNIYFQNGRVEEALPLLERAQSGFPTAATSLQIAEAHNLMGKFDDAVKALGAHEQQYGVSGRSEALRSRIKMDHAAALYAASDATAGDRATDEARAAAKRAIGLSPTDPWPHVLEGMISFREFIRTGRTRSVLLSDAERAVNNAIAMRAAFAPARMVRAELALAKNPPDYNLAITQYEALVVANPRDQQARRAMVQLCARSGDVDRAIEAARGGIEVMPEVEEWYVTAGDLYRSTERYNQAVPMYGTAWERAHSPRTLFYLGDALLRSQPAQPRAVLQLLNGQTELIESLMSIRLIYARALAMNGDWQGGVSQVERAFAAYRETDEPASLETWMAGVRAMYAGRSAKEVDELVHRLAGGDLTPAEMRALGEHWLVSERESGASRAIELFQNAADKTPADEKEQLCGLYTMLGRSYWVIQEYQTAADMYLRALTYNADSVEALNDLAYTYVDGLKRADDALPYAERAYALAPMSGAILDTLGAVHLARKNYGDAERFLRQSVEIEPSADNHLHLAMLYVAQNDRARARQYLDRGLLLRPGAKARAEIEALLTDMNR